MQKYFESILKVKIKLIKIHSVLLFSKYSKIPKPRIVKKANKYLKKGKRIIKTKLDKMIKYFQEFTFILNLNDLYQLRNFINTYNLFQITNKK